MQCLKRAEGTRKNFILLILFMVYACAPVPRANVKLDSLSKSIQPPTNKALLYIIRESAFVGGAWNFKFNIDGEYWGETSIGTYIAGIFSEGTHTLKIEGKSAMSGKKLYKRKTIYLHSNETSYYLLGPSAKDVRGLKKISKNEGENYISRYKLSAENKFAYTLKNSYDLTLNSKETKTLKDKSNTIYVTTPPPISSNKKQISEVESKSKMLTPKYIEVLKKHFKEGEYGEALDVAKSWVQEQPENAKAYHWLGSCYYRLDQFQEAINQYRKSNSIMRHGANFNGLGKSYLRIGNYKEAIEAFEEALKLTTDVNLKEIVKESMAFTYLEQNDFKKAAQILDNRSILGVSFYSEKNGQGLVVIRVSPNSPAEIAGLKKGDILTHFNGKSLSDIDRGHFRELVENSKQASVNYRRQNNVYTKKFSLDLLVLEKEIANSKRIKIPSDLEPIDEEYIVLKKANIRQKPVVTSRQVGQLSVSEKVIALGRVKGTNWVLVGKDFKPVGFVYGTLIAPVASSGAARPIKNTPAKPPSIYTTPAAIDFGRYHALVIGIDAYKQLPNLQSAVNDANAVSELLQTFYGFEVTLLLDARRKEIVDALDEYRTKLTKKDNLLIYYAGHGYYDSETDRGYWLPIDAQEQFRSNWVSNVTITDSLRSMEANHVLIVADSCYSGTLTRSIIAQPKNVDYIKKSVLRRSRSVLSSGGLEPVSDAGEHSVFARAFINALNENPTVMDGVQLFQKVRRPVILNSDQTPKYADIRFTGHEDGEFFFVRK